MPTLRLIATPSRTGRHENDSVANKSLDENDCEEDDRFSQTQTPDFDYGEDVHHIKEGRIDEDRPPPEASPFSIAAAIQKHSKLRRQNGKGTIGNNTNSNKTNINQIGSSATDVVAVVLSAAIRPPNHNSFKMFKGGNARSSRIHLLIGDGSLPRGECARVSMPASREFELNDFRPGDIVRWNKLEVWKEYDDGSPDGKRRKFGDISGADVPVAGARKSSGKAEANGHNSLLSVACELSSSWRDPTAGPSLARLCRIVPRSWQQGKDPKQQQQQKQADSSDFDLEWENVIPQGMNTRKEIVMELARWYCVNVSHVAAPSTHRPCQRRRLREITTPNTLSHVVVKVLRCERAVPKYTTPRKNATDLVVTHATLSDGAGSDDLIGITGDGPASSFPKSISAILMRSINEGSYILLTHALSQSACPSATLLQGRESLVLVPTRETTVAVLAEDHPYFPQRDGSAREEENAFTSQPLTLESMSQLFSMTQQHSPRMDSMRSNNDCRGTTVIVAALVDIIVDGVDESFTEGSHWQSPARLSKFLVNCPSISTGLRAISLRPSYHSATLVLDPTRVSREIAVNADGDALKMLCMDVPAEDMAFRDDDAPGAESNEEHPYLGHVGELLRALCSGSIPLRWVLEKESECSWFVTNATLLEI